ncbi:MAG: galactose ABC transporter substrate-binding protein [Bacilli bacterium]|jgi:methyl-galactoside transport system substrate-binding protein|nr:galactose ABC transporter substrate-binding protein [Bacilli bacterium]
MRSKQKTLWLLISGLCLSGCSRPSRTAQLFSYDANDTFISSLFANIESKLSGYIDYKSYDGKRKQTIQNDDFISAIDDKSTSVVVMNTVDRFASSAIIEKGETKNVPIIFVNREPLMSDLLATDWSQENCFYVGANSSYEGILQGDIASEIFDGPSSYAHSVYDKNGDGIVQVAILKGEEGHQDSEQRSENCIAELRTLGYQVEILQISYCNWERETAKKMMESIYSDNIELLFANNDDMALGAIDYLKTISSLNSNLPFEREFFPIIGVDGTTQAMEAIQDGTLSGTVLNDGEKQAEVIFDIIKNILDGATLPDYDSNIEITKNAYHVLGEKITKNTH